MNKFLVIFLLWPALAWADPVFDEPVTLKASEILTPELLEGPNHKVEEKVENDRFLYRYLLETKWGRIEAVSTPVLRTRIAEFQAMAEMAKLQGSQEFKSIVEQKAKAIAQGGKELVTDPGGSLKKIGKGVAGLFGSIGSLVGGKEEQGAMEGGALEEVSGFSKAKRQYAQRFGVDPYSRNELLQHELDEISKAGFLASTVTSMGLGKLGRVVGVAGMVGAERVYTESPDHLREGNRKKLQEMKVADDIADLFSRNANFTVTEQTAIVEALSAMKDVEERAEFVKFAILTDGPELASFRSLQAQLYSVYSREWQKLARFVHFGEFSCAEAVDGTVVIVTPIDQLLWTQELADRIGILNQKILERNPKARRVAWITGTFSPLAKTHLKKLGWELRPRALEKIKSGAR